MRRPLSLALPLTASVALIAAGCGSSSNKTSSTVTPSTPAAPAATTAAPATSGAGVAIAIKTAKFGKILSGTNGKTLYLFLADKTSKSTCNGACAALWPPLTGAATAGSGAVASQIGTTTRADGTKQVTYGGHPLYYYASDKDSGDAYGEGIKSYGAEWYAVGANGNRVEKPGG